jgi:hypothetical protein
MTVKSTLLVVLLGILLVILPSAALDALSYGIWLNEDSKGTAGDNPDFVSAFLPLVSLLTPVVVTLAVGTLLILWVMRRDISRET